jgi:hypothetical protein
MIDWNWQGWQYIKWITGFVILVVVLFTIVYLKGNLYREKQIRQEIVNGIQKLIYDTPLDNETTLKMIEEFIGGYEQ